MQQRAVILTSQRVGTHEQRSAEQPKQTTFLRSHRRHSFDNRSSVNARDLLAIVVQIEIECAKELDFVFLPGDNAENGQPAQYAFVATALKMLSVPVHAIPGDHDMELGSIHAFPAYLASDLLPKALTARDVRCLFLDMSGRGRSGPDFHRGAEQIESLEAELLEAKNARQTSALFMHTYPADLKRDGEAATLTRIIAENEIALVDMGHTHYNDLANDGRTIFSATKSTGQIEEGPVGYTIASIDHGIVSWRFKLLDEPFLFLLITAPSDHRLLRSDQQVVNGPFEVRALVFGARPFLRVEAQVDGALWTPMQQDPFDLVWCVELLAPPRETFPITVRTTDETGRPAAHTIRPAGRDHNLRQHQPLGCDAASIAAWAENGILGTQLGPNRNAKPEHKRPSSS